MIVIDTHVLVWWLTQPERLSPAARLALAQVNATNPAVLSAISILEITTAVRRGRMDLSVPIGDWLTLVRPQPNCSAPGWSAPTRSCASIRPFRRSGENLYAALD
ncbi:MAG: hypothetical protein RL260_3969 [Pseudomonadota bacterium]